MAKGEAQAEDQAALAARRRVEQQREREKRARERAQLGGLWSRRDVFGRFGWSVFAAFSGVSLLAAIRSAFPRVLFTPPSTFKAGLPTDYAIGEVSEKFKKDQRVYVKNTAYANREFDGKVVEIAPSLAMPRMGSRGARRTTDVEVMEVVIASSPGPMPAAKAAACSAAVPLLTATA